MKTNKELVDYLVEDGVLKTPAIIDAFYKIDRLNFIPDEEKSMAYADMPLPIGQGQTISQPYTVAFMLELLQPAEGQKILDVGSGSGYTTALLAQIVGSVGKIFAVERIRSLKAFGERNVKKLGFENVEFLAEDASAKLPGQTFDRILAGAAAFGEIPESWKKELKNGGALVAPVNNDIIKLVKSPDSKFRKERYPGFVFVPLLRGKE